MLANRFAFPLIPGPFPKAAARRYPRSRMEVTTLGFRQRMAMAALIASSVVAGWPTDGWAAGPPWLEWSAPPGCPEGGDIERRVSEWVGGPLAESGDLFVRTTLVRSGEQWEVGVVITRESRTAERLVSVSSCEAAADFVAIAVALAVDPGLAERLENDALAESPSGEAGARHEGLAGPVFGTDSAGSLPSVKTTPKPSAQADESPRGPKPEAAGRSPRPHGEARGAPWQTHITVWGEDAWQTLPRPTAGVGLGVGVDHGRWSLALGARRLLPATASPERAVGPIEFSLLGVRSTLGFRLFEPPVQVAPLVSVEGGAVLAHQQGSTADPVTEPWWLAGFGGGVFVQLSARVTLTAELELSLPLARPTFVLSDRSEVYQVGPGGRGLLGARFFFDSR